jgi:hypothetical protein
MKDEKMILIVPVPPNASTMKSTQLHEIVFSHTGKYELLCNFHKYIQKVLVNQYDSILESAQKRSNGHIQYYNLNAFDQNYGTVKSYHKDAWFNAYGVELSSQKDT